MGKYRTKCQRKSVSVSAESSSRDPHGGLLSRHSRSSLQTRQKRHCILVIYTVALSLLTFTANSQEVASAPDTKGGLRNPYSDLSSGSDPSDTVKNFPLHLPAFNSSEINSTTTDAAELRIETLNFNFDQNCSRPASEEFPPDLFTKEQRQNGAVVVHFLACIYMFYAMLLVCDEYFVPSVERICQELHISSDVAGATFMAVSTSAPELFTNVIGTFVTKGDLGVGTIVGSAVFNVLAVSAGCGLVIGMTGVHRLTDRSGISGVAVEWWSLTRDCFFYVLSVLLLVFILSNRRVHWPEALAMLLLYGMYIFVLYHNTRFKKWTESMVYKIMCAFTGRGYGNNRSFCLMMYPGGISEKEISEKTPLLSRNQLTYTQEEPNHNELGGIDKKCSLTTLEISGCTLDHVLISEALFQSPDNISLPQKPTSQQDWTLLDPPFGQDWTMWTEWILSWPIRCAFISTIPSSKTFHRMYVVTLFMCVAWIAALSYVISWMMTIIGETLQIPESVTGLTFLAAGTSIPEVISSIIVARQGLGSMGLSNSIGSNTFDVLVCLGLPWLIQSLCIANQEVNYIAIQSSGLEYSALLLIASMFVLYAIIAANGFILNKKVGLTALFMYAIFISVACLLELNIFFPVNLPPCA